MKETLEVIARPPEGESIREEFSRFILATERDAETQLSVMFGFAWGNDVYASDWLEEVFSPSELLAKVQEAEDEGIGSISGDDLYVTVAKTGLRYTFCHENDIHVEGQTDSAILSDERARFLSMGWQVSERINRDGRHGQWIEIGKQNKPALDNP